jgi:hypothetical protein
MDNKKKFPVTNIGTVSLLMIFIVLCMVIFAALSLSGAAADYRFSEKLATQNSLYYEASDKAEVLLAQIDEILIRESKDSPSVSDYHSRLSDAVADLDAEDADDISLDGDVLSYTIPENDRLALSVSLRITDPENISSDGRYEIVSWKEIQTKEWNGDNSMQLIQ